MVPLAHSPIGYCFKTLPVSFLYFSQLTKEQLSDTCIHSMTVIHTTGLNCK